MSKIIPFPFATVGAFPPDTNSSIMLLRLEWRTIATLARKKPRSPFLKDRLDHMWTEFQKNLSAYANSVQTNGQADGDLDEDILLMVSERFFPDFS